MRLRLSAIVRHNHHLGAASPRLLPSPPSFSMDAFPCYTHLSYIKKGLRFRPSPTADLPSCRAVLTHSSNVILRQATPARLRAGVGLCD